MIILDIDMPQSCWQCTLNARCSECEGYPDSCAATGFYESKACEYGKDNGRPEWCPIVGEIPKETDADWKCFMCEEKEVAYKVGYEEGLKAGKSAFNEGSKE